MISDAFVRVAYEHCCAEKRNEMKPQSDQNKSLVEINCWFTNFTFAMKKKETNRANKL